MWCFACFISTFTSNSAIGCKLSCFSYFDVEIKVRDSLQALSSFAGHLQRRRERLREGPPVGDRAGPPPGGGAGRDPAGPPHSCHILPFQPIL